MAEHDWLVAAFEQHRDHLRAVAYRLLGTLTDADDAVQETWLRLTGADTEAVRNLGGWLTTVVARVSLNMLRSRRNRPEEPLDESGTSSAKAVSGDDPQDEAVLADSVGLALLVVLDTLTPAERLAFVLHDMFAMPFAEVSGVLGRSEEATRQLASRARRRVRGAPSPDRAANIARQRQVANAFLAAARGGEFSALVALLDPDVRLTADSFASPSGKSALLRGANVVARASLASSGRAERSQLALVDDAVGIVFVPAGRLEVVLTLRVNDVGRIGAIDVIADPDRLRRLRLAVLPTEHDR